MKNTTLSGTPEAGGPKRGGSALLPISARFFRRSIHSEVRAVKEEHQQG